MNRSAIRAQARGFTLLELLVALAVFAILAVMAYGGLNSVMTSRQVTEQQAQRLTALQRALSLMQRDMEQTVPRGIRDELGDLLAALRGGGGNIEFTRGGWSNPANLPRSNLQRVAYAVDEDKLVRITWRVLDRAQDTKPETTTLVEGVSALELRFLDNQLKWKTSWPSGDGGSTGTGLPQAVEVSLVLEDWGRVTRLFRLPG